MNQRVRIYAVIGVIIILLGLFLVTLPQDRLILQEEYEPLELYPNYYFVNFTVMESDINAKLSFDINIDYGGNYSSTITSWILFQLTLEQFEAVFNISEAHHFMSGEDWDADDFGGFWAGWFIGSSYPFWESIPSGSYVLVFWLVLDGPPAYWSATLTVSLRTSLFPQP